MAASPERKNPWRDALNQALNELSQAEHSFEWADVDYCDYYIYRIQASKEKVALILRQARIAYGVTSYPMLTRAEPSDAIAASVSNDDRFPPESL